MQVPLRLGITGFATLLVGCYTLQPTKSGAPQPGSIIGLDINDVGRVALGGSMGPAIAQIEGRLVQRDTNEYVVAVQSIRLLQGDEQTWHGEVVHIKPDYVSSLYERRFSAARSAALAAVGVGAVAAIATRSLIGLGTGDQSGKQPGDTAHTQRRPRP